MVLRIIITVLCMLCLPLLLGVTEIRIGPGSTVNTGTVVGGDCLKGDGVVRTENRDVDPFREIVSDGAFDIEIVSGKQIGVVVSADSNLVYAISTRVAGSRLTISAKKSFCTQNPVVVKITLPELHLLQGGGSSDITLHSKNTLSELQIHLSGATNLLAKGLVKELTVSLEGSSEMDGSGFKAESVAITARDSSEATIFASRKVTGKSRDASSVTYYGKPKMVEVTALDVADFDPAD